MTLEGGQFELVENEKELTCLGVFLPPKLL